MRTIINLVCILVIGLGLGSVSAWYSIQKSHGLGAINIGQWSAWPFIGGSAVDPYTGAKVVTDGQLPLGAAEGLAFEATADDLGNALNLECDYVLEGLTPPAKLWTLAPYDIDGNPIASLTGGSASKYSGNTLRHPDGSFSINLGSKPAPGNWISITGQGAFKLVLRLYDTPVTSTSGLIDPTMPRIKVESCNS